MRLPYDDSRIRAFLDRVEGGKTYFPYVSVTRPGARIDTVRDADGYLKPKVRYNDHVLEEDVFLSDMVTNAPPRDYRDGMHRQGFGYFRISGYLAGKAVKGGGCIPFVYESLKRQSPWMQLSVGDMQIVDSRYGAFIENRSTGTVRHYPAQSLFCGLARPWSGLHVLDTVRRDAAAGEYWFSTHPGNGDAQARVDVDVEDLELAYTLDLDDDLLNRITLKVDGRVVGELVFEYSARRPDDLRQPRTTTRRTGGGHQPPGLAWLAHLVQDQIQP
jgi:hypothetical protein